MTFGSQNSAFMRLVRRNHDHHGPGVPPSSNLVMTESIILESPFLMWSQFSKRKHRNDPMLLKLQQETNRVNYWVSFGIKGLMQMHVDWQEGLLHELPALYLSTYQNTPVTLTCFPSRAFANETVQARISLFVVESNLAPPGVEADPKVSTTNMRLAELVKLKSKCEQCVKLSPIQEVQIEFSGIKKQRVEHKSNRYVIVAELLHNGEIIDRAFSKQCFLTSSRRFYRQRLGNDLVFPAASLVAPGWNDAKMNAVFWQAQITPSQSLRVFQCKFKDHDHEHCIRLHQMQPLKLEITVDTSRGSLFVAELISIQKTSGLTHAVHVIDLKKENRSIPGFFAESLLSYPQNNMWKGDIEMSIQSAAKAEGSCQLRLYWFDDHIELIERFTYIVPIIVSSSCNGGTNVSSSREHVLRDPLF